MNRERIEYPLAGEPPDKYRSWYFNRFGYPPKQTEVNSWQERSLKMLLQLPKIAGLPYLPSPN